MITTILAILLIVSIIFIGILIDDIKKLKENKDYSIKYVNRVIVDSEKKYYSILDSLEKLMELMGAEECIMRNNYWLNFGGRKYNINIAEPDAFKQILDDIELDKKVAESVSILNKKNSGAKEASK